MRDVQRIVNGRVLHTLVQQWLRQIKPIERRFVYAVWKRRQQVWGFGFCQGPLVIYRLHSSLSLFLYLRLEGLQAISLSLSCSALVLSDNTGEGCETYDISSALAHSALSFSPPHRPLCQGQPSPGFPALAALRRNQCIGIRITCRLCWYIVSER